MCNHNCGNNRGGCVQTIALTLFGLGLGKRLCNTACGYYCVKPIPRRYTAGTPRAGISTCGNTCAEPRWSTRTTCGIEEPRQTFADCYYARQYALYPCDRNTDCCSRCGGNGYRGYDGFGEDGGETGRYTYCGC